MSVASEIQNVLSTFKLVISLTQTSLPEDGNSLWYAILDQLSYTNLCNEPFFSPMPLHEKATSLRQKMTYKLERYIRSGAIKWNESSNLTIDGWVNKIKKDGRSIDVVIKTVSIYFDATIFVYKVKPLLECKRSDTYRETIGQYVKIYHPNTKSGSKNFYLLDYGKTRVTSRYQSVIPTHFEEKDRFNTYVLNKEALKRWISEDGLKRKSLSIYKEIGGILTSFTSQILSDAIVNCPSQDKKTITKPDICNVLFSTNYFEGNRKKLLKGLIGKIGWKSYKRKQDAYISNNLDRLCAINKKGKISKDRVRTGFLMKNLIHKKPFENLCKTIVNDLKKESTKNRIDTEAIGTIKKASEDYIGNLLEHTSLITMNGKRKTISAEDLELALRIRGESE